MRRRRLHSLSFHFVSRVLSVLPALAACAALILGEAACSRKPSSETSDEAPRSAQDSKRSDSTQPLIKAGNLVDSSIRFEFAIYYLPAPASDPVPAIDALLASEFTGLKRVETLPEETQELCVAAKLRTDVRESYAPPSSEALARFGRGVSKEQAEQLQNSQQVLVLDFANSTEHSWDNLRRACQFVSKLARQSGGLLWDEETREVFTLDAWDERRLKGWESGVPNISDHITIHAYLHGEYVRAITLGMAKFGLPDLVVEKLSWSANRNIGNLINLFAQAIAEGGKIGKDGEYDLDLKSLDNEEAREPQIKSLENHATAKAQLTLREGIKDDGDPNNRLIELCFDRYPGRDAHARQDAMVATLFGWRDAIKRVKHNAELEAASLRAKALVPTLRTAFQAGLAPGEYIQFKAPFDTPGGGHEYMWIEVTKWEGEKIKGLLKNEPFNIPKLHGGQIVEIVESKIFDYIRRLPDGTQTGNETGAILEKMQGEEEKR